MLLHTTPWTDKCNDDRTTEEHTYCDKYYYNISTINLYRIYNHMTRQTTTYFSDNHGDDEDDDGGLHYELNEFDVTRLVGLERPNTSDIDLIVSVNKRIL